MAVMKKIFDGIFDDDVHVAFMKFGRGEYKNKYLLEGKKQASKWAVKSGAEFGNFFVRRCLEKISGVVEMTGVIVSTLDLRDEIDFEIKKASNFQGVRKFAIDTEVESSKIIELMDKYPKAFFALTFKGDNFVLKIKPKGPASGKPGKEDGDGPKVDFCSLKTKDKNLINDLFFGVESGWKEIVVSHLISVTDIVYPENIDELKPVEIRELAKRKGKITRTTVVDGVEKVSEASFTA